VGPLSSRPAPENAIPRYLIECRGAPGGDVCHAG